MREGSILLYQALEFRAFQAGLLKGGYVQALES